MLMTLQERSHFLLLARLTQLITRAYMSGDSVLINAIGTSCVRDWWMRWFLEEGKCPHFILYLLPNINRGQVLDHVIILRTQISCNGSEEWDSFLPPELRAAEWPHAPSASENWQDRRPQVFGADIVEKYGSDMRPFITANQTSKRLVSLHTRTLHHWVWKYYLS